MEDNNMREIHTVEVGIKDLESVLCFVDDEVSWKPSVWAARCRLYDAIRNAHRETGYG